MDELIHNMMQHGTLHTPEIINAFHAVDRVGFVPEDSITFAHADNPIHIGYQQTISQPSTVAFMLELLAPQKGDKILDIGSGSGWTTALLAHIVGDEGSVLGLERIEELVEFGNENLVKQGTQQATIERAGTELGAPKRAPFDRILISATTRTLPNEILSQVREGGIIVLPVRNAIWRVERIECKPVIEKFDGYVFVPLIVG